MTHSTSGGKDDLDLHKRIHNLGVVDVSITKVFASLDGDSPGGLDKPASEGLAPELGRFGSQAQHIAYLTELAQ